MTDPGLTRIINERYGIPPDVAGELSDLVCWSADLTAKSCVAVADKLVARLTWKTKYCFERSCENYFDATLFSRYSTYHEAALSAERTVRSAFGVRLRRTDRLGPLDADRRSPADPHSHWGLERE